MAVIPGWSEGLVREEVDRMERSKKPRYELITALVAFVILIASVLLLWKNNLLLLATMVVECLLALARWHERIDVSFFLVIAVFGTLAELSFVRVGVWQYVNPTLLGIPLWFPLAFGTTGLIGGRLARTITDLWERERPRLPSGD
jgi:uncharacterized membrane protein YoaT (DUF817 family)